MTVEYIAYIFGIVILFILGRLMLVPMKIITKLILNAVIGGIVLLLINYVGAFFEFRIAFNVISALIVGFIGVPGIVLLVILKFVFGM